MAFLYGRAGRLTAKNGGFRPGQWIDDVFDLLLFHMLPGNLTVPSGLRKGEARTLQGESITVIPGGLTTTFLRGVPPKNIARVTRPNAGAINGVVHVIGTVLLRTTPTLPPTLPATPPPSTPSRVPTALKSGGI